MALMSELVEVGASEGLDKASTLKVVARRLREAGRLSQAGRGRGAAHMTYLDASRFLIACAATDHPERAVEAEGVFSAVTDENGVRLDNALAKFLEDLASGKIDNETDPGPAPEVVRLPPHCHLLVRRSGLTAELRVNDVRTQFLHTALHEIVDATVKNPDHQKSRRSSDTFADASIPFRSAKNLHAVLELPLFRAFATLIAGGDA